MPRYYRMIAFILLLFLLGETASILAFRVEVPRQKSSCCGGQCCCAPGQCRCVQPDTEDDNRVAFRSCVDGESALLSVVFAPKIAVLTAPISLFPPTLSRLRIDSPRIDHQHLVVDVFHPPRS